MAKRKKDKQEVKTINRCLQMYMEIEKGLINIYLDLLPNKKHKQRPVGRQKKSNEIQWDDQLLFLHMTRMTT